MFTLVICHSNFNLTFSVLIVTDDLPTKRKSVPVLPFIADTEVVAVKKRRIRKLSAKRGKKLAKPTSIDIDLSDSDIESDVLEVTSKVQPLPIEAIPRQPSAAQSDQLAQMEKKLQALLEENEKLKHSSCAVDKPVVSKAVVPMPEPPPPQVRVLDVNTTVLTAANNAPLNGSLVQACKSLYLDNINLRSEVDVYEFEAREHFRARKNAEVKLAQAQAAAIFDSLIRDK